MNGLKLADIEVFAAEYAKHRQAVVEVAEIMRSEMDAVKRKHINDLKLRVSAAASKKQMLVNALEANKALFDKPRTHVFNASR